MLRIELGILDHVSRLFFPPVHNQLHQVLQVAGLTVELLLGDCPHRFGETLLDAGGAGNKCARSLEELRSPFARVIPTHRDKHTV